MGKFRIIIAILVLGVLSICADQDTPQQQPQTPAQQQTEPAPPQTPSEGAPSPQTQSPGAAPQSPEENKGEPSPQAQSPAENQNATTPETTKPDSERPILKRKPKHKTTHKKKPATTQSGKVVVRNGGAKDGTPQLAPGMSKEQALHNRENTNQLLANTDANLKTIAGRQLTPAQQSMVEQIKNYMNQSKAASGTGDLNRAHTLAFKAHLLSDELAKK